MLQIDMDMPEKRILAVTCSGDCRHLRDVKDDCEWASNGLYCAKDIQWQRIAEKDCANCKDKLLTGISRQEAIERMAKAICVCDNDYLCSDCSCVDDASACKQFVENAGYDELAKAALDALVE